MHLPDIEVVAARVHDAWMASKLAAGIYSRLSETDEELMQPYVALSEAAKELDRATVRAVYQAIAAAPTGAPTEREVAAVGSAPRVTPQDVEAAIASEHYFTAMDAVREQPIPVGAELPLSLLTLCVLVLRNGYTVLGQSACASPENFNADIGRRFARNDAAGKIWPLLGFSLREKLAQREGSL